MYQLIEAKQRFASQIFTSKSPVRVAADVDESVLNYSQIKALASGNPKIREKIELEIELARLKTVENNYKREQRELDFIIRTTPEKIESASKRLKGLEADAKAVASSPSRTEKGELIPAEIRGLTYDSQTETGNAIFAAIKNCLKRTNGSVSDISADLKSWSIRQTAQATVPNLNLLLPVREATP